MTGEVVQRRIRPWSTQLVVPSDQGTVWFKANCPSSAYEPAVHLALSELEPDEVEPPLAIDADRGWMMTADRGRPWATATTRRSEEWQAVVELAARVQRQVADHGAALVAAGLPDCSPATVPARYAWLVEQLAALPADHPSHLPADEADSLRARRAWSTTPWRRCSRRRCRRACSTVTCTRGNVFVVDGSMRFFDFGDAQWAHVLEVLAVPYGYSTRVTHHPWPALLDAYARCGPTSRPRRARGADGARDGHPRGEPVVHLARRHRGAARSCRWGDSALYYLRLTHEPFPPENGPDEH